MELILSAIHDGDTDKVARLASGQVETRLEGGRHYLDVAAEIGAVDVVRALLKLGASAGATDDLGYTALHYAAANGQLEAVVALVEEGGSEVDGASARGSTALHLAAARGRVLAVRALVRRCGAAVECTDHRGFTPLHHAAAAGCIEAVHELLALGAPVNAAGVDGVTALMSAAHGNHTDAAAVLVRAGADVLAEAATGATAWEMACARGNDRTAEMLELNSLKGDIPMSCPSTLGAAVYSEPLEELPPSAPPRP